jgi:hypothetical protein
VGNVGAHNFSYLVVVIAMTVVVELISKNTFEATSLRVAPSLDKLLGAGVGVLYGALWASLFMVPWQYNVAETGGAWTTAVLESNLVPTLNNIFVNGVLDIAGIFFVDGTPKLFLNPISSRVSSLFLELASMGYLLS